MINAFETSNIKLFAMDNYGGLSYSMLVIRSDAGNANGFSVILGIDCRQFIVDTNYVI